jgi:trigger factor
MAGADYVRSEAIEEAIQSVVPAAIDEAGLDPVTVPSVSAVRDQSDDGTIEIDVLVTLWPVLESLPDWGTIEIEVERPEVTDDEIADQLDALRNQFAELSDHDGDLDDGDFALIDISARQGDEVIGTATAKDLMYEVGTESFIPGLDTMLAGAAVGSEVEGTVTLPEGFSDKGGEEVVLTVVVKEARTKVLPELTDDMVEEATEFSTVEELTEAIRTNMLAYKVHTQRSIMRDKAVQYALNEVDFEVPKALVEAEVEARVRNLIGRLQQDDISIQDYLRITGQTEDGFVAAMRDQADHALSTRILLESIAAIENWEVTDADLVSHVESLLQGQQVDAAELVEAWKASGQVESLTGDILRERALLSLVDAATPVDAEGDVVDLTPVEVGRNIEEQAEIEEVAADSEVQSDADVTDDESEE